MNMIGDTNIKNHNTVAVSGHPNPTHSPSVPGGGGIETHKGGGYKNVQGWGHRNTQGDTSLTDRQTDSLIDFTERCSYRGGAHLKFGAS